MPSDGLRELYIDELKDLYNAENQLIKALPKMAKAANSEELREGFEEHLEQTREQARRLERIFEMLDENPRGKKCAGMEGLVKEGSEIMKEDFEDEVLDAASQREFGGLLRWAWPWAYGDGGPLGQITTSAGFPIAGFFLAVTTGSVLALAALAVAGIWIPVVWWRALATLGGALLLCLMVLFFGPTKLIPMLFALGTLYVALSKPSVFATS